MIEFMIYARRNFVKLQNPHNIPRPILVSSLLLTAGIVLGDAYFIVFNLTFQVSNGCERAGAVNNVWTKQEITENSQKKTDFLDLK